MAGGECGILVRGIMGELPGSLRGACETKLSELRAASLPVVHGGESGILVRLMGIDAVLGVGVLGMVGVVVMGAGMGGGICAV